ncbi:MAG: reverse transcriptase family protein [Candidatus Uhrbacteria bacterium]|nr:reverse transcriptase family protein [Candidatus Uhrbacteria bacterium]
MQIADLEALCERLALTPRTFLAAWVTQAEYTIALIPKKNGRGTRRLAIPHPDLRTFQARLNDRLLMRLPAPPFVHGSVRGRSFVTHARAHVNAKAAFVIDLADAFTQATPMRLLLALATIELVPEVARVVVSMTTHEGGLPQGAPSSNALWNLVCRTLDERASEFARKNSLTYTRYTDELIFSHAKHISRDLRRNLIVLVRSCGFLENRAKVHYQHLRQGYLQITGVSVGEGRKRLTKATIRKYRGFIHHAALDWSIAAERVESTIAHIRHVHGGSLPSQIETAYRHYLRGRALNH